MPIDFVRQPRSQEACLLESVSENSVIGDVTWSRDFVSRNTFHGVLGK